MYARQTPEGHFSRNLHVPRNYSGNAFRRQEESPPLLVSEEAVEEATVMPEPVAEGMQAQSSGKDDSETSAAETKKEASAEASVSAGRLLSPPGFRLDLGRFFGRERGFGIGFEELLIIGLILLVSQSDSKDDLIFLLFLLLFIQ